MAERALEAWDLRADAVELVALQENAVFRVRAADGPSYALRIHRSGYHDLPELCSELEWTSALSRAGIGVPAPIPTRDGRGYAAVPVPGSGQVRYVGVVEWVDGVQLESAIAREEDEAAVGRHFEQLGRIAARIHDQAVDWPISAGFTRHALDADGLLGERPWWGRFWEVPELEDPERKLLSATRESLHAALTAHGRDGATYSLIHADLHPRNVLVDGERLHVIDFDDAGFGWHAYELAVALFSYQGQACFEAAREGLIAGYRSERRSGGNVSRTPEYPKGAADRGAAAMATPLNS